MKVAEVFKIRRYLIPVMHAEAENDILHDPYLRQHHAIEVFRLQHALELRESHAISHFQPQHERQVMLFMVFLYSMLVCLRYLHAIHKILLQHAGPSQKYA